MRAYLSGIGGMGMSALAAHYRTRGDEVFGSDKIETEIVKRLRTIGCSITAKQDGSGMPEHIDIFVYTEAIPVDAPERKLARERGIRSINYFRALGELTAGKNLIGICGTHGKSSTTAMAAKMCMDLNKDPNIVVGTKMPELNHWNWRRGDTDLWVVEACEYRRSFLSLDPKIALITNIDGDHFDAFASMDDYENAFREFLDRLPRDGAIIYHGGDKRSATLAKESGRKMIDADAEPMIALITPGKHMQKNAQLVLALARHLGLDMDAATESLRGFHGTWRRMELIGAREDGVIIVDDYAHHPAEIRATLAAMRDRYKDRRIIAVFQPHTHDRTLKLFDDFAASFTDADHVFVLDVYDARPDADAEKADVHALAREIKNASGKPAIYAGCVEYAITVVDHELKPGDVCIIMGAGDISAMPRKLL